MYNNILLNYVFILRRTEGRGPRNRPRTGSRLLAAVRPRRTIGADRRIGRASRRPLWWGPAAAAAWVVGGTCAERPRTGPVCAVRRKGGLRHPTDRRQCRRRYSFVETYLLSYSILCTCSVILYLVSQRQRGATTNIIWVTRPPTVELWYYCYYIIIIIIITHQVHRI